MKNSKIPSLFWLGDSIALQYQPYLIKNLEGIAQVEVRSGYREAVRDLNHPRGANCGDSSMVLAFVSALFRRATFQPSWVVFNCGLHDIKTPPDTGVRQVDLEDYEKNLEAIVGLIRSQGKKALWITTTPVDDERHRSHCLEVLRYQRDVVAYNESARRIMKERGVPILDLHDFTAGLKGELYLDHVHFAEEIRRLQADYLAEEMKRLLSRPESESQSGDRLALRRLPDFSKMPFPELS